MILRCIGAAGGSEEWDVEIHVTEPMVAVAARPHRGRPRHHTRDVFAVLRQARIERVEQPALDRVIVMRTTTADIVVRLYSGGRANVLCVDGDAQVVDCLKERDKHVAKALDVRTEQPWSLSMVPRGLTVIQALSRGDLMLGPRYAREACHRCGVDADSSWDAMPPALREHVVRCAMTIMEECLHTPPTAVIVQDGNGEPVFSLTDLHGFTRIGEVSDEVLPLIGDVLRSRFRERRMEDMRRRLMTYVERELRRTDKALDEVRSYVGRGSGAAEHRYKADLLLSTPDVHRSGLESIVLPGWNGEDVHIALDPRSTYAENAQAFYARARRAEAAARAAAARSPKLEARSADLRALRHSIEQSVSTTELQAIMKKENLEDAADATSAKKTETSPYRMFELPEGWTLYVGRSAQNNDELTTRFAKQKDVWLHARGVSGSHAVLRGTGSSRPPKKVLETAAAIVAYFSKARNAKYTPVVYTQRSNVRKPKGAAVGAVVLEREETIMVAPGLPPGVRDAD